MASMTLEEWCKENNREDLLAEWHPTKNEDVSPSDITFGNGKKVWWQCAKGHEWEATVNNRTNQGRGCPYCSGRYAIRGVNDLATVRPDIAKEWHPTKNDSLKPTDVLQKANVKVWWQCSQGHEWEASICDRTCQKSGCPICGGKIALEGFNDLTTVRPDIAKEWHPTKNEDLKPTEFTCGSHKKVWWQCSKGHEWRVSISNRTGQNNGCPYCKNKAVLKGFNDLATVRPDIAKEWHPTENVSLKPTDVTSGSHVKVWWRCPYGHEWQNSIKNRTTHNQNCPMCSGGSTSLPEQGVTFYLEQVCKVEQRNKFNGWEIDVYLPEYKIGIEYDGKYFHTEENKEREIRKNKKLAETGITLIRIKESDKNSIEDKIIYFKEDNLGNNYVWALNQLCRMLATLTGNTQFSSLKIDTDNDIVKIRERIDLYNKERSLSALYPEVAKEWHPEKNGKLIPEMFTAGSGFKAWWKCSLGHEWQVAINNRTSNGRGCPYCCNKTVLKGFNDLATVRPEIAKEWHPTKNKDLKPTDVTYGCSKQVWWQCSECGNEWRVSINNRGTQNTGCPACARQKRILSKRKALVVSQGSLSEKFPAIAKDWHPTRNKDLLPTAVTPGCNKKVWWICTKGHEWEATVNNRTGKEQGCPICSGHQVLKGFNDLPTVSPDIAREWHPTRNDGLTPTEVTRMSNKKVWWICSKGHEWEAIISNRVKYNSGCPYCSNKAILNGFNDLATVRPDIAKEWHPTKNEELKPTDVTRGCDKKVWWQCSKGHEWRASVYDRTKKSGTGCPYCSKKKRMK